MLRETATTLFPSSSSKKDKGKPSALDEHDYDYNVGLSDSGSGDMSGDNSLILTTTDDEVTNNKVFDSKYAKMLFILFCSCRRSQQMYNTIHFLKQPIFIIFNISSRGNFRSFANHKKMYS